MKAKPKTVRVRVSFEYERLAEYWNVSPEQERQTVAMRLDKFWMVECLRVERVPEKRRAK